MIEANVGTYTRFEAREKGKMMSSNINEMSTHKCRFLFHMRLGSHIDPAYEPTILFMLDDVQLLRQVSVFDEEPAEAVRADAVQFGVAESEPAGLLGFVIEKWLRRAFRYVTDTMILLPLDTAQSWGRRIDDEDDFESAVVELLDLADRFILAYKSKYSDAQAVAFIESCRQQRAATDGLAWDWNDQEDMVARIANAPTAQIPEEQELPKASAQERAILREHFGLGFEVSEIIDHLGFAPHIVFEEYAAWRIEEQKEFEHLEALDGDGA